MPTSRVRSHRAMVHTFPAASVATTRRSRFQAMTPAMAS